MPINKIGPLLNVLTYFDKLVLFSVEKIDHQLKNVESVNGYEPLKLGKYLSVSCIGCHKDNLQGGDSPIPGMPPVPNIISTGNLGRWKMEQFSRTLKNGKTPEGRQMKNEDMPWKMTSKYTDQEHEALYIYLQSLK